MKFEWDDKKARANFQKHGIEFETAKHIFDVPAVVFEDTRFAYNEERFIIFGYVGIQPLVVVYSYVDDETIRLISARKATNYERKKYFS
ncbi:MAG TPA: BrnT family toxin [Chloroflexota bacterium]|nr:BrnT family toxin [Chloroflexota bacterium]HUM71076.1 BrnT family toxin [Chloroflexota bacterium]